MMLFYHGTSSVFGEFKQLIPANQTKRLREKRDKERHLIFVTDSLSSARRYAYKCANEYGGEPVIYQVKPHPSLSEIRPHEYVSPEPIKIDRKISI